MSQPIAQPPVRRWLRLDSRVGEALLPLATGGAVVYAVWAQWNAGLLPVALLASFGIMFLVERKLAMRPQPMLRTGWRTDIAHVAMTAYLASAIATPVIIATSGLLRVLLGSALQAFHHQPFGLQFAETLAAADCASYFRHRLFHAVPLLWRLHAVHHSTETLDWIASARIHPFELAVGNVTALLPFAVLMSSPLPAIAMVVLYGIAPYWDHCNTRIRYGPLRLVISNPEFHNWHHANEPDAIDKNFAAMLPLWDILFHTVYMPRGRRPQRFGIDEEIPVSYLGHLCYPFAYNAEGAASPEVFVMSSPDAGAALEPAALAK